MRLLNDFRGLMNEENFLLVGKIVGAHGLKGHLKVYTYSGTLHAFTAGQSIYLKTPAGQEQAHIITGAKPHKKIVRVSLKGISTIDSAEHLVGSELFIDKKSLPELEDGTYYWFEIIGLSVFLNDDTCIGKVTSVIPTGSNDVYVVKDSDTDKEILIPAIESVVLEIDLDNQRMRVDLPEGLD